MTKNFDLEVRSAPREQYLKIFVRHLDQLEGVRQLVAALPSVKRVNITDSRSAASLEKNLTVYAKRAWDIAEVREQVNHALVQFFAGRPLDPQWLPETISGISDVAYVQILNHIQTLGTNMEKYPDVFSRSDEEQLRDYFLPLLNSISRQHSATGETFNKGGKTDILIQDQTGENVFIAECKIWEGQSALLAGLSQLLDRYVRWRDEKVALMVFNKNVRNFGDVLQSGSAAMPTHPLHLQFLGATNPTSFAYLFRHADDQARSIRLQLLFFNFFVG